MQNKPDLLQKNVGDDILIVRTREQALPTSTPRVQSICTIPRDAVGRVPVRATPKIANSPQEPGRHTHTPLRRRRGDATQRELSRAPKRGSSILGGAHSSMETPAASASAWAWPAMSRMYGTREGGVFPKQTDNIDRTRRTVGPWRTGQPVLLRIGGPPTRRGKERIGQRHLPPHVRLHGSPHRAPAALGLQQGQLAWLHHRAQHWAEA